MAKIIKKTIKFEVAETQYEQLKHDAELCGKKVNGYCRAIVLENERPEPDKDFLLMYEKMDEVVDELSKLREAVESLIKPFFEDKIIFRENIKAIENKVWEFEEKEAEIHAEIRKYLR